MVTAIEQTKMGRQDANSILAFIAVGANIEPKKNIPKALEKLAQVVDRQATSTFYRTKPIAQKTQPMFVNGVCQIETQIPPRALKFDILRRIEEELGRIRTSDFHAPRPIDLDLILYGDEIIDEADLRIPDSDIYTRSFVAIPLLELAPDLIIPGSQKRLSEIDVVKSKADLEALILFTQRLKQRLTQ